jgi:hypothetical protein
MIILRTYNFEIVRYELEYYILPSHIFFDLEI